AVGIPARILVDDTAMTTFDHRDRSAFSAYALSRGDDPLTLVIHQLIDHAAAQDRRIDALQEALLKSNMVSTPQDGEPPRAQPDDVPSALPTGSKLDATRLNQLVDKIEQR
ncbi:MAG: hypothetical protein EB006_05335, partial [Betaproteobacteria bacterium]|nr:hypothetical protein [Betaproteobacteria bacterium]